jgi:hypothetical protein
MNKDWYSNWGFMIVVVICMRLFGIVETLVGGAVYLYLRDKKGELVASIAMVVVSAVMTMIIYNVFDMSM